jgi:hypothetical protein
MIITQCGYASPMMVARAIMKQNDDDVTFIDKLAIHASS